MRDKTCCFTGHRKLPKAELLQIKGRTETLIKTLIEEEGVLYFGAGGALGFDTLAAQCVLELKSEYPTIKLILVLPCENQTKGWSNADVDVFEDIKQKTDKVVYTFRQYYNGCMLKRNRHLVDNSGFCICYKTHDRGGTAYTVNYAKQNEIRVFNVATGDL